jgi:hypothetical protein
VERRRYSNMNGFVKTMFEKSTSVAFFESVSVEAV